jgi:hypothetical protein
VTTNESTQTTTDARAQGEPRTVGPKEQLGVGVIALGLFALLMPWAADAIAQAVKNSDHYAILAGSVLVLGLFILAAGIAVILTDLGD